MQIDSKPPMTESEDRLQLLGAQALTDTELLTVLFGEESAQMAERLLASLDGGIAALARMEPARLRMAGGIGLRRALLLAATVELGRRCRQETDRVQTVTGSADIVELLGPQLEGLDHEECWVVYLSASNRILEHCRMSQGGVQASLVDSKLVLKRALELLAVRLILVHNHPSGTPYPSAADRDLTSKIASAARFFDIQLLDHIIIARSSAYSFCENGLL